MVKGLELFSAFFKGYEDQFVIIGGVAFRFWLTEIGENPRTTSDIDLVILTNNSTSKFIKRFKAFIKLGEYQIKSSGDGQSKNFRFIKPKANFPKQIELLTNRNLNLPKHQIASHHVTEEEDVFSAIMLDTPYYDVLRNNYSSFNGLSYVDKDVLILLKMKAWINFRRDFKEGIYVKPLNLKKHREDVIILLGTLSGRTKLSLEQTIINDIYTFITELHEYNAKENTYSVEILDEYVSIIERYFKL